LGLNGPGEGDANDVEEGRRGVVVPGRHLGELFLIEVAVAPADLLPDLNPWLLERWLDDLELRTSE
jgi:hypothetical protein